MGWVVVGSAVDMIAVVSYEGLYYVVCDGVRCGEGVVPVVC